MISKTEWKYTPSKPKEDAYADIIPQLQSLAKNYQNLSISEQEEILEKMVNEIRKINIFPIIYFNEEGIKEEILSVYNKNDVTFIDGGVYTQLRNGLLLLDFLFPNLHLATTCNIKTPLYERFFDDDVLKKCLHHYFTHNTSVHNMRTVFMSGGRFYWDTPINFAPMRAKVICEHFCPTNGTIYDYSAGFGGRMLGALCSPKNFTYIATDPNTATYQNLLTLKDYICDTLNRPSNCCELYNLCSEQLCLAKDSIDFIFSCPPFFKKEKYSDEITQSTNNYPILEDWLEQYVRPTIRHCFNALKENGVYSVDIMNYYSSGKIIPLVKLWIDIAKEEGFYYKGAIPIASRMRKKEDDQKEFLYLFMKKQEYELPDYTIDKTIILQQQRKQAQERAKYRKEHRLIGEYNIYGKLLQLVDYYNHNLVIDITTIKSLKNSPYNNKYYKIYYGDDIVQQQLTVKKPVCKIRDNYYLSYADAAKALGISRQAVSAAHHRNSKQLNNSPVEWLK